MQVIENQSLKELNTFGFNVSADFYLETNSDEALRDALNFAKQHGLAVFLLGGGSNLVLTRNVPGLTIRQKNPLIRIESETANAVTLFASAAVDWHQLVLYCVANGFYGIENLSLIPGSVGAAPIQNIGAYGVELSSVLSRVEALEIASGKKIVLQSAECEFAYRESIFKQQCRNRFAITGIVLRLGKTRRFNLNYAALAQELEGVSEKNLSLTTVSDAVCRIRRAKLPDPQRIGNAGSFFKNPLLDAKNLQRIRSFYPDLPSHKQPDGRFKIPAAWLVEKAGWKGYLEGDVGVHRQQSIVLVNHGAGDGLGIIKLASEIRSDVLEKFGVSLEIEPVVV